MVKGKDSLSLEEMEILSLAMLLQYISPLIARDENLKQTLSSKDFSSTSQANHLEKLLILKKSIDADLNYAFQLINYRYNNDLVTIVSSELLMSDLRKIDEAIAGRMKQKATNRYMVQIGRDENKNYRFKDEVIL